MNVIENRRPLVSVIIPAYNSEKTICETLDSVFSQTYKELQVIVIEDASTDSTLEKIKSFEDPRLEILALDRNVQLIAARNAGLERVEGEYIAFLDSDDLWKQDKLEKQVAFLERERAYGACFTWSQIIDENGQPYAADDPDMLWHYNAFHEGNRSYRDWFLRFLTGGNFLNASSALIRSDVIRHIGGQNLSLLQLQDFEYWIRVLSQSEIYILCEELVFYRRLKNGTSLSSYSTATRNRTINEDVYICTHFFEHLSDECFASLFRDLFCNQNSSTPEELACEKAFLLKNAYCGQEAFLVNIQRLLSSNETAEVLSERFGYTPKDFYQANAQLRQFEQAILYQFQDNEKKQKDELNRQIEENQDLQKAISEYQKKEDDLKKSLTEKEEECQQLRDQGKELQVSLTEKEEECQQLRDQGKELQASLAEKEDAYSKLAYALACREGECQQLRDKENRFLNELAAIKATRSWRLGQRVAKFARFFVPAGSKRAMLARMFVTMVKHPGKFFSCLTPKKLKKFFRLLRRGDMEQIQALVQMNVTGQPIPSALEVVVPEIAPVEVEAVQEKTAADYPVLTVPQWENPTVSIVIPVYNQFEYTYHCVESILKNSGDITYEIMIANDCSTDLTTEIEQIIPGVRCITTEKNLRFLLNCKNAASHANGKYILFLNNDTQVMENWLEPLVTLIESKDDIGMVGSKLIYPDGLLQEAGGILWRDGSAWNYGNRQNAMLPEFNYVKEADYISAAAVMIRKSLWNEIGGFDERFVPAYYEDTDLAFTVRSKGYRVMYQPKSVVVHFEGVSNGTDTSSGLKAYQVTNQKRFFEKWKDVLEAEHFENGTNVFSARDRSAKKETVLVIDHYIPTYDKDAGSRSMDNYLRLLVDMGLNVKFLGDNFYHDVHYADRYERMGIEILYGVYYRDNWKKWIDENADKLDYVLLSRPHISIKYIDYLRKKTHAKIVYYVQDLHFLREEREYALTHDPERLESAKRVKEQEMYIMNRSDAVFTLSQVEKDIIDREVAKDRAVITPISYFSRFNEQPVYVAGKKNIIFVGGFGHHPNEDGVLWFMDEVWNKICEEIKDCRLVIIGSKPTDKILALQSNNVVVTGFVSDEELERHYEQARICIIPLRYGAGVKGKTIEAMYHRVPIVSTSVGIEGLAGIEEHITPADNAEAFAQSVIHFWKEPEDAEHVAEGYNEYLRDHMSYESALKLFENVFKKG